MPTTNSAPNSARERNQEQEISTWARKLSSLSRTVFAYSVLPNLPFLLAARFMHVQRALVNLDYLAWGVASAWLPWPIALAGCIILLLIDFLLSFSSVYYLDFADAVSALSNLIHLSPWYSVSIGAATLCVLCLLAFSITRLGMARRNVWAVPALGMLALLLFSADALNGTNMISRDQSIVMPVNVLGSTAQISMRQLYGFALEFRNPANIESVPSASALLLRNIATGATPGEPRENIVLILEESLGLSTDARITDAVLAPFAQDSVTQRYEVSVGSVPFHGATVAAEFRELCGAGVGLRSREVTSQAFAGCLPARLRAAGYQVEALHGFTARMFRRDRWYPRLGIDHFLAAEQLGSTLGHCGVTFEGICDDQIASFIGTELRTRSSSPRFIYWLTLNSHLPVEAGAALSDSFPCSAVPATQDFADVCALSRVLHWTNDAIAKLAADPALPPTRFIIVGDHAPPFLSDRKRALYSQDRVPYIELRPRAPGTQPDTRMASKRELAP